MNITITHTISPDVIKLLEAFVNNAGGTAAPAVTGPKKKTTVSEPVKEIAGSTADAKPEATTIEMVRDAIRASGKREEVKALLGEFGVDKATNLPADQYASFIEKLKAL